MSRSYKKTPRCGDKKQKFFKKYANHRIRRRPIEEVYNHKTYKRVFCSYDICDYEDTYTTFDEFWRGRLAAWYNWRRFWGDPKPDKKQSYQDYMKIYKRK